jgi:DNA mismatch repair protein MSH5
MLDLQQASLLLKFSTRRSLLIVDEFGKGTDLNGDTQVIPSCPVNIDSFYSLDGAGLACGIFEYLLSLGDNKPKILAATHFHEIFENGFLPERESLALGHMEVRIDEETADNKEQVTYLYKYSRNKPLWALEAKYQ